MADNRWEPKAGAVAQVDTVTIGGTYVTGDTVTVTINSKDLVVTINETSPSTTTVALAVKEAWNNDTFTDSLNTKSTAYVSRSYRASRIVDNRPGLNV